MTHTLLRQELAMLENFEFGTFFFSRFANLTRLMHLQRSNRWMYRSDFFCIAFFMKLSAKWGDTHLATTRIGTARELWIRKYFSFQDSPTWIDLTICKDLTVEWIDLISFALHSLWNYLKNEVTHTLLRQELALLENFEFGTFFFSRFANLTRLMHLQRSNRWMYRSDFFCIAFFMKLSAKWGDTHLATTRIGTARELWIRNIFHFKIRQLDST